LLRVVCFNQCDGGIMPPQAQILSDMVLANQLFHE